MEFCIVHQQALLVAVRKHGMEEFVAVPDDEDELGHFPRHFDVIAVAQQAIVDKFQKNVEETADFYRQYHACPLCEVLRVYTSIPADERSKDCHDDRGWIDLCLRAVVVFARSNGLIGNIQ